MEDDVTNFERCFETPEKAANSVNKLFYDCQRCPIPRCRAANQCGTILDCERRIREWLEREVEE